MVLKTTVKLITHRITVITITIIFILIISVILGSLLLFLNLDKYKSTIESNLSNYSGYKITTKSIHTSLYNFYQPELVINDMIIKESANPEHNIAIKQINLILSYASLWKMSPIFSKIIIHKSKLDLRVTSTGETTINSIPINSSSNEASSFDVEKWLLQQKFINLVNIDLSFSDLKHDIPQISLYNISAVLKRGYDLRKASASHTLNAKIYNEKLEPILGINMLWLGDKLTHIESMPLATLSIQSYNNTLSTSIIKSPVKLPTKLAEFSGQTAVTARVENGRLLFLKVNFDTQNLQNLLTTKYATALNLSQFGGSIDIWLSQNDLYNIVVKNLKLSTLKGPILKDTNIKGWYLNQQKGLLTTSNIDLGLFNHFLNILPMKLFNLNGNISQLNLKWTGNIFKPKTYLVDGKFNNIAILSKTESVPSIDKISGGINFNNESGVLSLNLDNSTLKYPYVFGKDINLTTHAQINWRMESHQTIGFSLPNTIITTQDFTLNTSGKYTYIPNTLGYINLLAHLDQAQAKVVPLYLPKQIGDDVIKWLKQALVKGTGNNGDLTLKGNLDDFPFESNQGEFYINADVHDGELLYEKDWAPITDINGTFSLRNTNITIKATSAKASGNPITNALAIIPDIESDNAVVNIDGAATGETGRFLDYLTHTPLNAILGNLPQQTKATGNGDLLIHLVVPISNPETTQVKGNYNFKNNNIQFSSLPIPLVKNVNGTLFFTQDSLTIKQITAKVLKSHVNLNAKTVAKDTFAFAVDAPYIDYKELSSFYLPYLKNFISGLATDTKINFTVSNKGLESLHAKTNLKGVRVSNLQELSKAREETKLTTVDIKPINHYKDLNISYNYGYISQGSLNFIDGKLNHSLIKVSLHPDKVASNVNNDYNAKLIIKVDLSAMSLTNWLDSITKLNFKDDKAKDKVSSNTKANKYVSSQAKSSSSSSGSEDALPILVTINTPNLYLSRTNLYQAKASILIKPLSTIFAINNTSLQGEGSYTYDKNYLKLNFDTVNLKQESKEQSSPTSAASKIESSTSKVESREKAIELPNMDMQVKHLVIESLNLGRILVNLTNKGSDTLIQRGFLGSNDLKTTFSGKITCITNCPSGQKTHTNITSHTDIQNMGKALKELNYANVIDKGKGFINANVSWDGGLNNFEFNKSRIHLTAKFIDGTLLKVDTNDIFAQLLKLINLQAIFDIAKLNFKKIVSNGFDFNEINIDSQIDYGVLDVKEFRMQSNIAKITMHGQINLNTKDVNMSVTIMPKLDTGVAIGASILTANPLVGILAFLAEQTLDTPISKIFSLNYRLSGKIGELKLNAKSPGDQIKTNVGSLGK